MAINLLDITSNNNDLTNNNGATEVTTSLPFGTSTIAVDCEVSSSQYLSIADASQTGLDLSGDFTLEGWFKFETLPSSGSSMYLISKDDFGSNRSYSFHIQNVGGTYYLQVWIFNSSNGNIDMVHSSSVAPSTGTWYHYAVTCTIANAAATEFLFYKDGTSLGNGTVDFDQTVTAIKNTSGAFLLGGAGGSASFDGIMDDIRVWNDVRTGTEITNNKDVRLVGNESNLVAYWPFELLNTAYTKDFTENVVVSDSIIRAITKTFTESAITVTDSISKAMTRIFTDNTIVSDTISTVKGYIREFTDTVSANDISVPVIVDSISETEFTNVLGLSSVYDWAQGSTFDTIESGILNSSVFYLQRVGSPTGNIVSKIYEVTGSVPNTEPTGSALAVSDNIDVSSILTSYSLINFNFSGVNKITLTANHKYIVDIEWQGGDADNYIGSTGVIPRVDTSKNFVFLDWDGWFADSGGKNTCFYVYKDGAIPLFNKGIGKTFTDNIEVTEVFSKIVGYMRTFTDNINVTDNIEKLLNRVSSGIPTLFRKVGNAILRGFSRADNLPRGYTRDKDKPTMV